MEKVVIFTEFILIFTECTKNQTFLENVEKVRAGVLDTLITCHDKALYINFTVSNRTVSVIAKSP